ncbi:spore germination protein [Aneurinibacillus terranovensis]|uniref:spore germination protein n=1 Tax=Aneurinibacillus terranovensis TaxID=278991 RepID=UPI0004143095|nr:spore germination protein [Aneurinibacillus terranovensis]
MNVALVRKRLKTNTLTYEQFIVGKRSHTKAGLLFIKDIVRPEVIDEVKRRFSRIDIDAVFSSQELIELISERPTSLFPLYNHTGRPDHVVASLVRGRFAILLDGTPTAIIAPMNLMALIKSPEDVHTHYLFVSFERLFRIAGLIVSLFFPGFYIAISTYHPDQIPLSLLATIATSRKGVPIPTPLEAIIMLLLFELFREAGARLPNAVGQTLSVVGGLIIGDAAIRAGLTSPSMIVVISTTAVANFTLVNQAMIGTITVLRMIILLISSIMGVFGFTLSVIFIVVYLSNLRSFGIPYLSPVSPITFGDLIPAFLRPPIKKIRQRSKILNPIDKTRRGNK